MSLSEVGPAIVLMLLGAVGSVIGVMLFSCSGRRWKVLGTVVGLPCLMIGGFSTVWMLLFGGGVTVVALIYGVLFLILALDAYRRHHTWRSWHVATFAAPAAICALYALQYAIGLDDWSLFDLLRLGLCAVALGAPIGWVMLERPTLAPSQR